jgi:hypothetical protein
MPAVKKELQFYRGNVTALGLMDGGMMGKQKDEVKQQGVIAEVGIINLALG